MHLIMVEWDVEVDAMIVNQEMIELLDEAEQLTDMILQSEAYNAYKEAHYHLIHDQEAQELIQAFVHIKATYEEVQRFGRYHPDYNQIMREVRAKKRQMDLNEKVASFKVAERELQRLLDDISELIAHSVSEHILVPKDGIIDGACGCGSGGSCGCQAS